MNNLCAEMAGDERSGAIISACGQYRYHLWRRWNPDLPTMCWVMLNPSTADASADDPTIRRCIGFAKREGCGGISVRNVFALRATDPKELLKHRDPVGPDNEEHLLSARNVSALTILVLGWGSIKSPRLKWHYIKAANCLLPQSPWCLGTTKDGQPLHPLYLPADAPLTKWKRGAA